VRGLEVRKRRAHLLQGSGRRRKERGGVKQWGKKPQEDKKEPLLDVVEGAKKE